MISVSRDVASFETKYQLGEARALSDDMGVKGLAARSSPPARLLYTKSLTGQTSSLPMRSSGWWSCSGRVLTPVSTMLMTAPNIFPPLRMAGIRSDLVWCGYDHRVGNGLDPSLRGAQHFRD